MSETQPERSDVVLPVLDHEGGISGYAVYCPGCKQAHIFDKRWTYNNNSLKPTFRNSMLVTSTYGPEHIKKVCHSFVTDGQIQFLDDCTHELKGKTVPLEPFHW